MVSVEAGRTDPMSRSVSHPFVAADANDFIAQAVSLIVIDEIHMLGADRGPVLEVIVSRTNYISSHTTHKVGLAAPCLYS